MGRQKKVEVAESTLRWRKYHDKQMVQQNFHDKNKQRAREFQNKRLISETAEQKKSRLATKARCQRERRATLKNELRIDSETPYSSPNSIGKATNRALMALPKDRTKRVTVLREVLNKTGITVKELHCPRQIPESFQLAIDFYFNPRITYTMPGMSDTMVIKTAEGKETVRKYFLTVFTREAYAMFNECYGPILKRSTFYSLHPKNVLLMKDTPKDVCKCLYHENMGYIFQALGGNYVRHVGTIDVVHARTFQTYFPIKIYTRKLNFNSGGKISLIK